jgi:hypothetical protein
MLAFFVSVGFSRRYVETPLATVFRFERKVSDLIFFPGPIYLY